MLHNTGPLAVAVNTELPQLFTTLTSGGATVEINGEAISLRFGLAQPSTVCDTVYVPSVVTVIELVVSPVLHTSPLPAAVSNALPQLLFTVTAGGAGTASGAAMPKPEALVQPPTVCVTP